MRTSSRQVLVFPSLLWLLFSRIDVSPSQMITPFPTKAASIHRVLLSVAHRAFAVYGRQRGPRRREGFMGQSLIRTKRDGFRIFCWCTCKPPCAATTGS